MAGPQRATADDFTVEIVDKAEQLKRLRQLAASSPLPEPGPLERVSLTDLCRLTGTNMQTVASWQKRHGFQLGSVPPGRQHRTYDVVDLAMMLGVTSTICGASFACRVMNMQRDRLRRLALGRARPGEQMIVKGAGGPRLRADVLAARRLYPARAAAACRQGVAGPCQRPLKSPKAHANASRTKRESAKTPGIQVPRRPVTLTKIV